MSSDDVELREVPYDDGGAGNADARLEESAADVAAVVAAACGVGGLALQAYSVHRDHYVDREHNETEAVRAQIDAENRELRWQLYEMDRQRVFEEGGYGALDEYDALHGGPTDFGV